jgi:hypothetical protein
LVLLWTHEQQLHRLGPKRSSDSRVKSDERRVLERGPKKKKNQKTKKPNLKSGIWRMMMRKKSSDALAGNQLGSNMTSLRSTSPRLSLAHREFHEALNPKML